MQIGFWNCKMKGNNFNYKKGLTSSEMFDRIQDVKSAKCLHKKDLTKEEKTLDKAEIL